MASAIMVAPFRAGVGPIVAADAVTYTDGEGNQRGGWSCIGQVPQAPTFLVRVWCSDEQLVSLSEDSNYVLVEVVSESSGVIDGTS